MFFNVLGPSDALALRLCNQIAQGQAKINPPMVNGGGFGPRAGTFKEGYRYLIADTCYPIPVTCHLLPVISYLSSVTCHLLLDT